MQDVNRLDHLVVDQLTDPLGIGIVIAEQMGEERRRARLGGEGPHESVPMLFRQRAQARLCDIPDAHSVLDLDKHLDAPRR
jgi:hypothetical protein